MLETSLTHRPDASVEFNLEHDRWPLSLCALATQRSLLRELVALVNAPGVLSFAGGLPAPELFPQQELATAFARALADPDALQYGPEWPLLSERVAELMGRRGVACTPDQVLITTGAQQGVHILSRMFLDPGGLVAMEDFTYTGLHQAIAPLHPQKLALASGPDGLDVCAFELALAAGRRPAFLYLVADHANPTGVSIPLRARRRIAELARSYRVPVIEDDPYGHLTFEGPLLPAVRSYDADWIFYVGSFSKIVSPGLRLGWVVLPPELAARAAIMKEAIDLECSGLVQRAVASVLTRLDIDAHLTRARSLYRERRDVMMQSLETSFGDRANWCVPRGGFFAWVELRDEIDTLELLNRSLATERIAFVPGAAFETRPGTGRRFLRLSYSLASSDEIRDGLARLARLV